MTPVPAIFVHANETYNLSEMFVCTARPANIWGNRPAFSAWVTFWTLIPLMLLMEWCPTRLYDIRDPLWTYPLKATVIAAAVWVGMRMSRKDVEEFYNE